MRGILAWVVWSWVAVLAVAWLAWWGLRFAGVVR